MNKWLTYHGHAGYHTMLGKSRVCNRHVVDMLWACGGLVIVKRWAYGRHVVVM